MPLTATFGGVSTRNYGFQGARSGIPLVGDFNSIATTTVGAGGASSIIFSSIPQTYTHLQIRGISQAVYSAVDYDNIALYANGDSGTNYAYHLLRGNGTNAASGGAASNNRALLTYAGLVNTTSSIFGATVIDILDYTNTNKHKTMRAIGGFDYNGGGATGISSSVWLSTSAINSLTIFNGNGNWKQYTSFALYGINA